MLHFCWNSEFFFSTHHFKLGLYVVLMGRCCPGAPCTAMISAVYFSYYTTALWSGTNKNRDESTGPRHDARSRRQTYPFFVKDQHWSGSYVIMFCQRPRCLVCHPEILMQNLIYFRNYRLFFCQEYYPRF